MIENDVAKLLKDAEIDEVVEVVDKTSTLGQRNILFTKMYVYLQSLPKLDHAAPHDQVKSDLARMNQDFKPLEGEITPLERWLLNALDQVKTQQVLSVFFQNMVGKVQNSWRNRNQQAARQRRENRHKPNFQPPNFYVSLIDRVDQVKEFKDKWSYTPATDIARTHIVVIDGQHGDGHDYMLNRLVRIHLAETLAYPVGETIPITPINELILRAKDFRKELNLVIRDQLLPHVSRLRSYPVFAAQINLTPSSDVRRIADTILEIPSLAKETLGFPTATLAFIKFCRGDSLLDRFSDWRCSQRFQHELQRVTQQGHRDIWLTKLSFVTKDHVNDWSIEREVSSLGLPLRTWTDIKDFFLNNERQRFEPFARQVENVLEKCMFSTS